MPTCLLSCLLLLLLLLPLSSCCPEQQSCACMHINKSGRHECPTELRLVPNTIIEAISLKRFRERRARGKTGAEAGNHHNYRAILFRLWYWFHRRRGLFVVVVGVPTFFSHGSPMSHFLSDNPGPNLADALAGHISLSLMLLPSLSSLQLLISVQLCEKEQGLGCVNCPRMEIGVTIHATYGPLI